MQSSTRKRKDTQEHQIRYKQTSLPYERVFGFNKPQGKDHQKKSSEKEKELEKEERKIIGDSYMYFITCKYFYVDIFLIKQSGLLGLNIFKTLLMA